HSACPHDCPSTCALEVERIDARTIGRVRGAADNPYTAGVVCAKVGRYAERVHHPDRLTRPLKRVGPKGAGPGAFVPVTWEEALDTVAGALRRAAERHGPETVWPYYYAGTMGLVQRDGINRLRHVMGYSRQNNTICTTLADSGWLAGVGLKRGVDGREMGESDLVVIWGGNPVSTQVNVMAHATRARKERGAKIVVVDVYRTPTAEVADHFLCVRPGTDAALACAVMHVLFGEGFADRDYMARYADCPEALEAHLATRTPAWASGICGVPEDEIVAFARLYGATKRSFIRVGYGFARARNGASSVHAVTCLPTVTGAWRYQGGGALYSNGALYGIDKTLIEGLDRLDPKTRLLDQSRIGPILVGDRDALGDGPPVTALFIQNTNPMMVAPETLKVRAGFARDDLFTCVHEQFLTETASMADIVLPATTFLEHDDMYQASGNTFFQVTRAVIEPLAEARSNHWVLAELARRLGADHPGFRMSEWEIMDAALRASGYPTAAEIHAGHWVDRALPFERAHFLDGFPHRDGKFHFRADWQAIGTDWTRLPPLPDQTTLYEAADDEHPFRMLAPPARSFLNSSFTETPSSRKREGRPTARMHPADLAALGLADGDRLRLGNRRASVVLHARAHDGQRRGVVVVEGIWPNHAFEEGLGINALTSADPGPPAGGAVFHDTAVWVKAA
ncbi:MAG: molybdopterin oxidoreductase family protein, partial [Alphaproteobacteria bacterium]|nr:molybdopterin oxidoreductase family protein [Alphaproteobacteria bacterium]